MEARETHNESSTDMSSEAGVNQLCPEYFKQLFKKEWKIYYSTPEYNERLYLQYKGKPYEIRTFDI